MTEDGKTVAILLAQGFEDLEYACALDYCGWTAYRTHMPDVEVTPICVSAQPCGRFGLRLDDAASVSEVDPADFDGLVIPGGFRPEYDEIYCDAVYAFIREIFAKGLPIATMCVGAIPVARSGVLKGLEATTYEFSRHDNFAMLEEQGCTGVHVPVCVSENVISCSGPAYSADVMDAFMRQLIGDEAADELQKFHRGISLER